MPPSTTAPMANTTARRREAGAAQGGHPFANGVVLTTLARRQVRHPAPRGENECADRDTGPDRTEAHVAVQQQPRRRRTEQRAGVEQRMEPQQTSRVTAERGGAGHVHDDVDEATPCDRGKEEQTERHAVRRRRDAEEERAPQQQCGAEQRPRAEPFREDASGRVGEHTTEHGCGQQEAEPRVTEAEEALDVERDDGPGAPEEAKRKEGRSNRAHDPSLSRAILGGPARTLQPDAGFIRRRGGR